MVETPLDNNMKSRFKMANTLSATELHVEIIKAHETCFHHIILLSKVLPLGSATVMTTAVFILQVKIVKFLNLINLKWTKLKDLGTEHG